VPTTTYATGSRAERDADAQFVHPLRHIVSDHAVQPYRGYHQGRLTVRCATRRPDIWLTCLTAI
jgi:hypothetical protein